jgi:hypothetical protein
LHFNLRSSHIVCLTDIIFFFRNTRESKSIWRKENRETTAYIKLIINSHNDKATKKAVKGKKDKNIKELKIIVSSKPIA